MLNEREAVAKVYDEIQHILNGIHSRHRTKTHDEIIKALSEEINPHEAEELERETSIMYGLIKALNLFDIHMSYRDPVFEALVDKYLELLP